jgi:hypothetical protein
MFLCKSAPHRDHLCSVDCVFEDFQAIVGSNTMLCDMTPVRVWVASPPEGC